MDRETVIEADLTWVNGAFEPNVQVVVGENGLIEQVGFLDIQPTLRLESRALLPGMVNAHSHAFQRGLRGFGEGFSAGVDGSRAWREAQDELVECLDAEEFKNLCRIAFQEMLHHGITTVGEFHYLHHARGKRDYAFDDLVLEAAAETGIRIVLLCCYYAPGSAGQLRSPVQERFETPDIGDFCAHVDRLRQRADGDEQRIGLSVYSVLEAAPEALVDLADYTRSNTLVMHLHAEKRIAEIEACRKAHGAAPVALLLDKGVPSHRVTLVHCTHTSADDLRAVAATGAKVCICPSSEGNLGSGAADMPVLVESGAGLCLGTDSNVRISMNEQMRWCEYVQRTARCKRGICLDSDGRTAPTLWNWATSGGAAALSIPAGRIASGCFADFLAIDTRGLSLLGATPESLMAAFVFGADRPSITHTCVGGRWHRWDD